MQEIDEYFKHCQSQQLAPNVDGAATMFHTHTKFTEAMEEAYTYITETGKLYSKLSWFITTDLVVKLHTKLATASCSRIQLLRCFLAVVCCLACLLTLFSRVYHTPCKVLVHVVAEECFSLFRVWTFNTTADVLHSNRHCSKDYTGSYQCGYIEYASRFGGTSRLNYVRSSEFFVSCCHYWS